MNHADLINTLLTAHGTLAGLALVVFYTYSDRTDGFGTSLKGITSVIAEMRRRITAELGNRLDPVFQSPGSVPSPLFAPDGNTYVEHSVNPVGSEAYREALRDFVESHSESMADYRSLTVACSAWCFWAGTFSWLVLGLLVWQVIVVGSVFLDKLSVWTLPDGLNCAFWGPTVLVGASCMVAVVCRCLYFNKLTKLRVKHGEL
jgi:hypothetical protein